MIYLNLYPKNELLSGWYLFQLLHPWVALGCFVNYWHLIGKSALFNLTCVTIKSRKYFEFTERVYAIYVKAGFWFKLLFSYSLLVILKEYL